MQRLFWCSVELFDALICFTQGNRTTLIVCSKPDHLPTELHEHTQPPVYPHHNTTLLLHHAPQLIADPAPNPLLVHHITQSHLQCKKIVHAPQTGRNGAAELICIEVPDATARGASVVVV